MKVALANSEAFVFMSVKDPVCGMPLDPKKGEHNAVFLGRQYFFDSEYCMNSFIEGAKVAYLARSGRPNPFFRSKTIVSVQKTQSGSSQSTTS